MLLPVAAELLQVTCMGLGVRVRVRVRARAWARARARARARVRFGVNLDAAWTVRVTCACTLLRDTAAAPHLDGVMARDY